MNRSSSNRHRAPKRAVAQVQPPDFAMFLKEGNAAVARLLTSLIENLRDERPAHEAIVTFARHFAAIAEDYPEISDTAVHEAMAMALDTAWLQDAAQRLIGDDPDEPV